MSTSTSDSRLISKLYKSRDIILTILIERGYNVDDYSGFSVNEIHTMYINQQLDMIFENPTTNNKLYIKYHLATKLRPNHVYETLEDLFDLEEVLTEKDELIIICKDKINDTLKNLVKQSFINDKRFLNIYNLNDYLYNILDHTLVPKHTVLDDEEKKLIIQKYKITKMSQFPEISRFDPVAQALGIRPGQLCKIKRPSPTSVISIYYRYCC